MKRVALLLAMVMLCSCDRDRRAPATIAPPEPTLQLEVTTLTPLLPNRPTHAVVDSLGNVYWTQESDRKDDTLFVMGEGDIPRATQLSAGNIAAAMNADDATGNIQSVAAGPEGRLYFFFLGAKGRKTIACVGQFSPKSSAIRILSDTDALMSATEMGKSLTLARATIIFDGRNEWLWVRHTDAWALFRFDPRALPATGAMPLRKAFEFLKVKSEKIELTREEYELCAGPDQTLYWLDPPDSELRQIDANGNVKTVQSLVGLPSGLSCPTKDKKNRLIMFAANAPLLKPATPEQAGQSAPVTTVYPALLIFNETKATAIGREDIVTYPGFPVFGMRLRRLSPEPSGDAWVSYDFGSGELLRLKIREKSF